MPLTVLSMLTFRNSELFIQRLDVRSLNIRTFPKVKMVAIVVHLVSRWKSVTQGPEFWWPKVLESRFIGCLVVLVFVR
jgi:hypothetical protein